MKIISFAWTTPALIAGRKTVTRRDWDRDYAERFQAGELIAAYDRSPRFKGKQVATIRLTEKPHFCNETPIEDWEGEGFAYLESIGAKVNGHTPRELWDDWREETPFMWVVRFEVVTP